MRVPCLAGGRSASARELRSIAAVLAPWARERARAPSFPPLVAPPTQSNASARCCSSVLGPEFAFTVRVCASPSLVYLPRASRLASAAPPPLVSRYPRMTCTALFPFFFRVFVVAAATTPGSTAAGASHSLLPSIPFRCLSLGIFLSSHLSRPPSLPTSTLCDRTSTLSHPLPASLSRSPERIERRDDEGVGVGRATWKRMEVSR